MDKMHNVQAFPKSNHFLDISTDWSHCFSIYLVVIVNAGNYEEYPGTLCSSLPINIKSAGNVKIVYE